MASYSYRDTASGRVPVLSNPFADPPEMPRIGNRPHVTELGVTGTHIQSGLILNEEFNSELTWKEGLRTWDTMRRVEPQISSTLRMIELPILSAEWKMQPGTDAPDDLERAAFAESAFFHSMRRSWQNLLRHTMIHLWAGFMDFEQTWRVENGRTIINDIAPRLPRTINRWWTDQKSGELIGVQQWAYRDNRYDYINIPSQVLIHFANQQEGQNYEGISILRTAYKPYWYKQNFERLQAVGFEREHVGIPVIKLPEGYTEDDRSRAAKIGQNIRSHEQAYVALPPGWEVEWLKSAAGVGKKGTSILDMLYYLDRQMQQNVLAQFMSLGTTDVGSYALSNDQSRVFLMALKAVAGYVAETYSYKSIKPLIDYNYASTAVYPKLIHTPIHAYNFVDLTTSIANLVSTQVIPISAELEDYVYDMLGVPIPPRTVIESTNPITGYTQPSNIAAPATDRNESAGGIGFNEAYRDHYVRLGGKEREIYARMAADAGRPRSAVRLNRPHQWVSAPQPLIRHPDAQQASIQRRLTVSESARKAAESAVADLTDEIEALLAERD